MFDTRLVRTFRKPNPSRLTTEVLFVIRDRDLNLRPARFFRRDEREEPVSRAASDDLEHVFVLQLTKGIDQVSPVTIVPQMKRHRKVFDVHLRCLVKLLRLFSRAMLFFLSQFKEVFEVLRIAFLEKRISKHFAKRRRDVHGDPGRCPGFVQMLKNEDKRKVNLRYCFVEPVLFEKLRILRVPDKRQMGVKNETEVSDWHKRVRRSWPVCSLSTMSITTNDDPRTTNGYRLLCELKGECAR